MGDPRHDFDRLPGTHHRGRILHRRQRVADLCHRAAAGRLAGGRGPGPGPAQAGSFHPTAPVSSPIRRHLSATLDAYSISWAIASWPPAPSIALARHELRRWSTAPLPRAAGFLIPRSPSRRYRLPQWRQHQDPGHRLDGQFSYRSGRCRFINWTLAGNYNQTSIRISRRRRRCCWRRIRARRLILPLRCTIMCTARRRIRCPDRELEPGRVWLYVPRDLLRAAA